MLISLNPLFLTWENALTELATSGRLLTAAEDALQLETIPDPLTELIKQWQTGDFSQLPTVELLSHESMSGAMGAYASSRETIYLNEDWLATASEEDALAVLMEELGHHLDNVANERDTLGDEGAIFASLVQGKSLEQLELQHLRAEDDSATLAINGELVQVEQATFTVTIADDFFLDDGELGLGEAIQEANNNFGVDIITFDSSLSGETIGLNNGSLNITDDLIIKGLGANQLTIDGAERDSVFNISNEVNVTLSGLGITGGSNSGIVNNGTLELTNSIVFNNSDSIGRRDFGSGGLFNTGTLTLMNSTVFNNSVSVNGDFGSGGGGIYNNETITLMNSTVFNNSVAANNNGISRGIAGGIRNSGSLTLANSIIAANTGGSDDVFNDNNGELIIAGANLVEDGSVLGGSVLNENPQLEFSSNNGESPPLQILQPGSPAIDAGTNTAIPADTLDLDEDGNTQENIPFDQLGRNRVIGDAVDLGAVEVQEVGGGNQAPVAEDDTASTGSNSALNQNVLSNDSDAEGDSLTVSAVNGEESNVGSELTLASGALLTLNADGSFEYDPNNAFDNLAEGETATDSFSYTVSDGNDGTDTANVAIDITGIPVPSFNLDVDNNGVADPFTDGLTIFRFLGGLNPETYELASDADRSVTAVQEFLFGGETFLDVDNNGVADPFTDGLTIFRFLGGLNPETYELASDADRSVAEIQEFLQPFLDAV